MGNGQWAMENGKWKMENGKFVGANGYSHIIVGIVGIILLGDGAIRR
jgi:hypothetical protein